MPLRPAPHGFGCPEKKKKLWATSRESGESKGVSVGTEEDPDRALVDAAQSKNERAMERLYRKHAPAIRAYALRATQSSDIADEVTQETFVRAFKSLHRFEGRSTFRTWLFSIALNRTRTAAKRRARSFESLDEEVAAPEGPAPTGWLKKRLSRALGELPEGYREVVIMHDVLGMGHEEIADARRCSVGTSKSQLHKARAKLRGLLGGADA